MAQETLSADPIFVLDRFNDEVQLACPLFQRPYVWARKNIQTLWDDLDTVLDEEYPKRFLGALVFSSERATTATSAGRYWIIDGQQRLTTIYLILLALADEAAGHGPDGITFAKDTFEGYLLSKRSQTKGEPKLRPTLTDTKQFDTLLLAAANKAGVSCTANPNIAHGDPSGTLTKAFDTIKQLIRASIRDRSLEAMDAISLIRDSVLETFEFVEIRLGADNDPNEVFDRLNNVGEKLGIVDLIRNEVLKDLYDAPEKALAVYSNDWLPFEQNFNDDAARAKYFFPFTLTIDSSVTQASTFTTLSRYLNENAEGAPDDRVGAMVKLLRRQQMAYNAIASGKIDPLTEPLREQVRRLVSMSRPSSVFPYVMQAITTAVEQGTATQAAKCLAVIESFLVRRAFLGIEPTGLHAIFKKLWGNAKADPAAVRVGLQSATVMFPSDGQFELGIRTSFLYKRRIARYILEEYERGSSTGDVLSTYPDITIDHVMPQKRKDTWEETFTEEEHENLLHTWANLVPLSSETNSMKGSSSWEQAQERLGNETVFSTTKHLYDSYTSWTPRDIQTRADHLVEWALDRWPSFDDLAVPAQPEIL